MLRGIAAACVTILPALAFTTDAHAQNQVLHRFAHDDGDSPTGAPIISGGTIYGFASNHGISGGGTVFQMKTDGTGYTVLHSFSNSPTDGRLPLGSPTVVGTTVYGLTLDGGAYGAGTLFQINTDGSGFQILHSFSGTAGGAGPDGFLLQVGNVFYGTTRFGGVNDNGTLFQVNTDGSNFKVIHTFSGGQDGAAPWGSLILAGGTLYGTASASAIGGGTIFRLGLDGLNFSVLHSFTSTSDGGNPYGDLTAVGGYLYGMTATGGAPGRVDGGTIFRISQDGSTYETLHYFSAAGPDVSGSNPQGSLIASGDVLWGMAGISETCAGSLFEMNVDGTGFQNVVIFNGDNGLRPLGTPALSGSTLYGMTNWGGGQGSEGVLFSYTVPEPGGLVVACSAAIALVRRRVK